MADPAAVRVESVRCLSFRGLDDVHVDLHPEVTVLVGRNNAGKSRILRAIAIALGSAPADRDDFTAGGAAVAHIDIVIAPANPDGSETFDARVGARLTSPHRQTISTSPIRERISWRTTIRQSSEGFAARTDRFVKQWDASAGEWTAGRGEAAIEVIRLCRGHIIETGRDLATELRQRGTAAHRLIDDLELDSAVVDGLQTKLDALSADVVSGSLTLRGIEKALTELSTQVDAVGAPTIRPMPGKVRDLSTVASVELAGHDGQSLPLHLHGTGARSLASLQLQGLLYERRLGADGGELRPHPVTLVEEPEAHLHPQAQFDLSRFLQEVPGQVVVSTHSTHLVSELDPAHLRIITPTSSGAKVTTLEVIEEPPEGTPRQLQPRFYPDEMEKLRRGVERPFGELLFASAVVIGDGATERAFLPIVLRHALGRAAHGLCVVDPGSMNSPATIAIVKAARLLGTPWFLFADGDHDGVLAVDSLLDMVAKSAVHQEIRDERVVQLPTDTALEGLLSTFDVELCHAALAAVRPLDSPVPDARVQSALEKLKGSVGRYLAEELIRRYPEVTGWPQPLQDLVRLIRTDLATTPDSEDTGDLNDTSTQS